MKKKVILFSSIGGAVLIAAIVLIICLCLPKGDKAYRSIKLYDFGGTVTINRDSKAIEAVKNLALKSEDELVVGDSGSKALLKLDDDKYIMAKENTKLKLQATGKQNKTKTRILVNEGGVVVEVKNQLQANETFEIASSNSVMAIRGTQIGFDVEKTETELLTKMAILHGKTDVMLLKDNALKSTSLIINQGLTYSTPLTEAKSVDEVSKLLDTTTIDLIDDANLESEYNTTKRELTSEEIDSIVDAVNSFDREEEDYLNGTIKVTSKVFAFQYGINPESQITLEKDYGPVAFYYSQNETGPFDTAFDEANPIEVGTWYCKILPLGDNAYRSDPFQFDVIKRNVNLNLVINQTNQMNTALLDVKLEDDEGIFDLDSMKELEEYGYENKYKYYVKASFNPDGEFNAFIDADNKNPKIGYVFSDRDSVTINVDYNLPDYYNVTMSKQFTYNFKDSIDYDDVIIVVDAYHGDNKVTVYPNNYYSTSADTEFILKIAQTDIGGETNYYDIMDLNVEGGIYSFNSTESQIALAIGLYGMDVSEYRIYDISFEKSAQSTITSISGYNHCNIITYNDDRTINAYVESQFSPESENIYYFSCITSMNVNGDDDITYFAIGSNLRFICFEDLLYGQYNFRNVDAVLLYNSVYYLIRQGGFEDKYITPINDNETYLRQSYDEENGLTTVFSENNNICMDEDIILYDDSREFTIDKTYMSNYGVSSYAINGEVDYLVADVTVYGEFSNIDYDANELFELDGTYYYLYDSIYETIKEQMEDKYGVTMKGSNKNRVYYSTVGNV